MSSPLPLPHTLRPLTPSPFSSQDGGAEAGPASHGPAAGSGGGSGGVLDEAAAEVDLVMEVRGDMWEAGDVVQTIAWFDADHSMV